MRSLLFVPGDSRKKLDKALECGADALIVDLEDSVAAAEKTNARREAGAFLRDLGAAAGKPRLLVRINPLTEAMLEADLGALPCGCVDGIMLPKAEGRRDVRRLARRLDAWEARHGVAIGRTGIMPIATETARGLLAIASLPRSSGRLCGIAWGAEDLSADLGAETNRDADGEFVAPYRHARMMTLVVAAAAETIAVDTVHTNFRDLGGLAAESAAARRDGFGAKMAIHPAQVPIINEAFSPSAEAIADAEAIVAAFDADPGLGVVGIGGEMVDRPHLKRAQRILTRAGR